MADAEFVPTPAEIAAACAEIRAGWSAKIRAQRKVKEITLWQVPRATIRTIRDAARERRRAAG